MHSCSAALVEKKATVHQNITNFTHYDHGYLTILRRSTLISFLTLLIMISSLITSAVLPKFVLDAVIMIWDHFWLQIRRGKIRKCVTFSVVPVASGGNETKLVKHCQRSLLTRPSAVLIVGKLLNQRNPPTSGPDL